MLLPAAPAYVDASHPSTVMGEARHYRLFLPPDYDTSGKRYPVVYYFHGHSDRYTLEKYDEGTDTVPKIAAFVRGHDVIVVAVDGYVARDYTGFYGGSPWDVRIEGGQFDFGAYFLELVAHIDGKYRTLTTRRHRATSGLSMGGFMSAYLSARYPDAIGSASIFNPGPEFFVGEPGRRSLWRPKDHAANHGHSMVRLIRASGDYISQYHEETRAAYAASAVDFEFRQDEYHRHWATSIGETLDFHLRAFANTSLDAIPRDWSYTSAHRSFAVWGFGVDSECTGPALLSLEAVSPATLRLRAVQWAPDGPPSVCSKIQLRTGARYRSGAVYRVLDYDDVAHKLSEQTVKADVEGRLTILMTGGVHQLSFVGPGIDAHEPVLLPLSARGTLRVNPGSAISLPVRLYNPGGIPLRNVVAELSSDWPTVEILSAKASIPLLNPGEMADIGSSFKVRFTAGDGDFARARLRLRMGVDGTAGATKELDVLVAPDALPEPVEVAVLDGRAMTFAVFRQQGNRGGGTSIQRQVREGSGNANGIFEPGEQATIWLRLQQGIDPFDKNNWCRAKVYPESPAIEEAGDIQEDKQREWTGAQNRTSLLRLKSPALDTKPISMVLDCESYSFQASPGVRYGREPLYQPFQVHKHHLFRWRIGSMPPADPATRK
jgi:pimeloyl-ACP methyl ester carboxylesterase